MGSPGESSASPGRDDLPPRTSSPVSLVVRPARLGSAFVALALGLVACGGAARLPLEAGFGPTPDAAGAGDDAHPDDRLARGVGWPAGAKPTPRKGLTVDGVRHRPRPSALALRAARTATCSSPRPMRRRGPTSGKGIKGWFMKRVMKSRRRRAEREPHHAAARRRRRRRRRDAHGVPRGAELAVRHGARRRRPLRRQHRRGRALPVPARRDDDHRDADEGRRPAGRPDRITTGPRTSSRAATASSSTSRRLEQQRRRERHGRTRTSAPRSGRSTRRPARIACSPPACAIPSAWRGSRETGALWTAVNERDELGSDLVPDYMTSVRGRRLLRLAVQLLRPARRRAREAAAARSRRAGDRARLRARRRTRHRSASRRRRARALPAPFRERHVRRPARLVEPQAAQRLQGDLRAVRATASRSGAPVDVLTGFLTDDGDAHGPAGRRRDRQARRAARRRRRRQHGLASLARYYGGEPEARRRLSTAPSSPTSTGTPSRKAITWPETGETRAPGDEDADQVQRIGGGDEHDLAARRPAPAHRAQRLDRLGQRELLADEAGDEAAAAHLAARLEAAQRAEQLAPRRQARLARAGARGRRRRSGSSEAARGRARRSLRLRPPRRALGAQQRPAARPASSAGARPPRQHAAGAASARRGASRREQQRAQAGDAVAGHEAARRRAPRARPRPRSAGGRCARAMSARNDAPRALEDARAPRGVDGERSPSIGAARQRLEQPRQVVAQHEGERRRARSAPRATRARRLLHRPRPSARPAASRPHATSPARQSCSRSSGS